MEKPFDGFKGLYNHITPNVSDEALITQLKNIVEFVDEANLTPDDIKGYQREVDHIAWELNMRKLAKVAMEEEISWMEKAYAESPDE